jgi:TPR repeat protein
LSSALRWLTICAAAWTTATFATQLQTPAEIDRLRMYAGAGRDNTSLDVLLDAARAGSADAQRAAGEALINRPDQARAAEGMTWLTRAAVQNDTRAMIMLGKAWLFGASAAGRAPDARQARAWFERAQPNVNPQAAYYLGIMEKGGYGKPADPVAAAAHFRFAAQQNLPEAMYLLGNAYASGEGVDVDPREAMRWYLRAASLEHPQATQELAHAFARGDTLLPQSDFQAEQMRRAVEHALRHPKAAP